MANTILNFVLVFCVGYICCNDDILSKFHQNKFKVKDDRTEVVRFNTNIFHNFEIKTYKYNRTTPAHNFTVYPKINLDDKLEIIVQTYKLLSNEYRHFPIRFQVKLQKIFEYNVLGFKNLKMCGNTTNFVFHKDIIYHFCNFVLDDTRFPPLIPNGLYKNELLLLYLDQEAALVNFFGEVYTPKYYQKK